MGLVGIKPKKASQNTSLQQKNLHYWAYLKHIGNTDAYYVYYKHPPQLFSLYKTLKQTKPNSKVKANIVLVSHFPFIFLFASIVQDL